MALNSAALNSAIIGGITLDPDSSPGSPFLKAARSDTTFWFFDLYTRLGAFKWHLPNANGGKWTDQVNGAGSLTFRFPYGDDAAGDIAFSNQVWLSDADHRIVDKFWVTQATPLDTPEGQFLQVECMSLMYQLMREKLGEEYVATSDDAKTVKEILVDLFALQTNSLPITLGNIAPAIATLQRNLTLPAGRSIFDGVRMLFDSVSQGFFVVDAHGPNMRDFKWQLTASNYKAQQLRVRKNVTQMAKNVSTLAGHYFNRLYAYGDGLADARLDLQDAGETYLYIEDATDVAANGVWPEVIVLPNVPDADTLLAVAQKHLAMGIAEYASYEVSAIDLYAMSTAYARENLSVGNRVDVIDENLEVDTTEVIVKIDRTTEDPTAFKVTLAHKQVGLPEFLDKTIDRVSVLEQNTSPAYSSFAVTGSTDWDSMWEAWNAAQGITDGAFGYTPGSTIAGWGSTGPAWGGFTVSSTGSGHSPSADVTFTPFITGPPGSTEMTTFIISDDAGLAPTSTGDAGTSDEVARADQAHSRQVWADYST